MIRTQEMVPDYYIEKSRDFQVLCRLYDYAFNALKYNVNSMVSLTDTRAVKDTILPLVGNKFGIYEEDSYTNRQMLEALPSALRNKGSLKSVKTLINAFLDSMGIFEYALAYNSKDEESAQEISAILNREVKPYTLVVVLSQFPGLTNLHILETYMKMVVPTGMDVEYMFTTQRYIMDKFRYNENVFLFYIKEENYTVQSKLIDDTTVSYTSSYPREGLIKNKNDKYSVQTEEGDSLFTQRVKSEVDINIVGRSTVSNKKGN